MVIRLALDSMTYQASCQAIYLHFPRLPYSFQGGGASPQNGELERTEMTRLRFYLYNTCLRISY
jgi:hypothetical protein